jgi:peptidoglycan hydrolase-like protein with peptidoglycan-binding domain
MTLRPRSLAELFVFATLIFGLVSCSASGDEQGFKSSTQNNSRANSLQVEQNSGNREACYIFAQPKDAVAPGTAMDETINFYRGLSEMSTGSLSDVFQSVARATVEIAPYYNADEYPPQNLMTALQEETMTAEILCQRLFNGTQNEIAPTTSANDALEALRSMQQTLCDTMGNSCNSPLLDDDPSNDLSTTGASPEPAGAVSGSTLPFATETNKYWNAKCPKELRRNDVLPLVKCDRGNGVRRVQELLGIEADGLFGNDTYNALLVFQAENQLEISGEVGAETWFALDPSQLGPGTDKNSDDLITPDEFAK